MRCAASAASARGRQVHRAPEALRYASHRFGKAEEWQLFAVAAWHADDKDTAAAAYLRYLALGGRSTLEILNGYATALNAIGRWIDAAPIAKQLVEVRQARSGFRTAGAHAMAVALLGQARYAEAQRYAREALAGATGRRGEA